MKAFNVNLGVVLRLFRTETKLTREPWYMKPISQYPVAASLSPLSRNRHWRYHLLQHPLSPIPPAPRVGHPLSLLSPPIPPAAMAAPLPLSPNQPLSRHWYWRFKLPASVNGDTHVKNEPPL